MHLVQWWWRNLQALKYIENVGADSPLIYTGVTPLTSVELFLIYTSAVHERRIAMPRPDSPLRCNSGARSPSLTTLSQTSCPLNLLAYPLLSHSDIIISNISFCLGPEWFPMFEWFERALELLWFQPRSAHMLICLDSYLSALSALKLPEIKLEN